MKDETLERVWKSRDAIAKRCDYDPHKLVKSLSSHRSCGVTQSGGAMRRAPTFAASNIPPACGGVRGGSNKKSFTPRGGFPKNNCPYEGDLRTPLFVIPTKVGIQCGCIVNVWSDWIPAFAGKTTCNNYVVRMI